MHYLRLAPHVQAAFYKNFAEIQAFLPDARIWIEEEKGHNQSEYENRFVIYYWTTGLFRLCSFKMSTLPGCCGTLILHYRVPLFNLVPERAMELCKIVLKIQEEAALDAKFTQLVATCLAGSQDARLYSSKAWRNISEYVNVKTRNTVRMYQKILRHKSKKRAASFGEET